MKRFGHLFEKLCSFHVLKQSTVRAAQGKKKKAEVAGFLRDLEKELMTLQIELRDKTYQPKDYNVFMVHDPKERRICAADFRDRVVHHSICRYLEPILEKYQIHDSYACRKEKGNTRALQRAQYYLKKYPYYLKLDIQKFFDTIDHEILKDQIRRKIKDPDFLWLMDQILDRKVPWADPGKGLPIGNLTSQTFANHYLSCLDHFIKEDLMVKGYVRYMDDMVLFAEDKTSLRRVLEEIESYLCRILKLKIKEGSVVLSPSHEGLSFLGFRVYPAVIRASRKGWRRFRRKVMRNNRHYDTGLMDFQAWHRSMSGLMGYMKQADTRNLRVKFFTAIGGKGQEPCYPRRQLEQHRSQLPVGHA